MASRNDGLAEALMQFAANSAQLIDKAKASGLFKRAETVDVTPSPVDPASATADASTVKALQDIIVQQAMRIHALEAEVARLSKPAA